MVHNFIWLHRLIVGGCSSVLIGWMKAECEGLWRYSWINRLTFFCVGALILVNLGGRSSCRVWGCSLDFSCYFLLFLILNFSHVWYLIVCTPSLWKFFSQHVHLVDAGCEGIFMTRYMSQSLSFSCHWSNMDIESYSLRVFMMQILRDQGLWKRFSELFLHKCSYRLDS